MKVTFYGTRGSMPVPDPDYMHYGGNTSCILVTFSTGRVAILDAGTGIRKLGNDLLSNAHEQYGNISIILSHTHWDHIQGFPFFDPAYDPQRNFTISICGKDRMGKDLEHIFAGQMQSDLFPVPLHKMGANFTFLQPDITTYENPWGIKFVASKHSHRGDAYSYRIEEGGKTLAYCTDVEHKDGIDPNVVALSRNADLLIHDAQYTPEELEMKKGWGHSSWEQAIEVAEQAGVKKLALFHHDPDHNDTFLSNMEKKCQKRYPQAFLAIEGNQVTL
ncbi:MAG: MBL fold metallo-hydrolase [Desulfobacterales bacterium]